MAAGGAGNGSLPPKANQCAESLRASELCNSSMHWLETATGLKREKRYGLSVAVSGWQDLAGSTRGAGGAGFSGVNSQMQGPLVGRYVLCWLWRWTSCGRGVYGPMF